MRLLSCSVILATCWTFAIGTNARADDKSGEKPKTVTTKSGLKYQDIKKGTGETAKKGDEVIVHYTGWLKSGKKFDSSKDRGEPFKLTIGKTKVIKGWTEGLQGMKAGGVRKLIIPSDLAYGARGYPGVIPANAELTFEIQLLKVKKAE